MSLKVLYLKNFFYYALTSNKYCSIYSLYIFLLGDFQHITENILKFFLEKTRCKNFLNCELNFVDGLKN